MASLDGLTKQSEPNVFSRNLQLNYMEVEMDNQVAERIMLHTAAMHLATAPGSVGGDNYIREQVVYSPAILGEGFVHIMADGAWNFQKKAGDYEMGLDVDVGGAINPKLKNYVKLASFYSVLSNDLAQLNQQINAGYQNGQMVVVKASGQFGPNGRYGWMLRRSMGLGDAGQLGDRNRTDAMLTVKIGKVKK